MAKHHTDLVFCRKLVGMEIGRLCEKCDGRCVICDSYVRPKNPVFLCDDCSFGELSEKCLICNAPASEKAFYCHKCCLLEKDRDGCPKVINLGMARLDKLYGKRRFDVRIEEE